MRSRMQLRRHTRHECCPFLKQTLRAILTRLEFSIGSGHQSTKNNGDKLSLCSVIRIDYVDFVVSSECLSL